MIAIVVAGSVLVVWNVLEGLVDSAGLILLSVWATGMTWFGVRTATVAVLAEEGSLIVRNQFRTHRIPLGEITGLVIRRKLALWALGRQVVGYVTTQTGEVFVEASQSWRGLFTLWLTVHSQSEDDARLQMAHLSEYLGAPIVDLTDPDQ